jgi:itaconyl-CoA hydratase
MTRFEDFTPGDRMRHARGTTIGDVEGQLMAKLVMNSAQAHFNDDAMAGTAFGQRIVFGLLTASIVIGLATQDTAEDAIAEVALDNLRFLAPVFHGDTLYASTEVLWTQPASDRADAGLVGFKHWGFKPDGTVVFEGERTVLLKRASHHPTPTTAEAQ